jgi:hypothetical protein
VKELDIGHYKFIGECFVENLMDGWVAPLLEEGDEEDICASLNKLGTSLRLCPTRPKQENASLTR